MAKGSGDKLRTEGGAANANHQQASEWTASAFDFAGMDFGREGFYGGESGSDFVANFRSWREGGIAQPIMTDHSILIRVGNRAGFEFCHCIEGLLQPRSHARDEFIRHVGTRQIN